MKCYLDPEQLAYLKALCAIHVVSISDAVALAVTHLMRGEPAQQPPRAQKDHTIFEASRIAPGTRTPCLLEFPAGSSASPAGLVIAS